MLRVFFFVMAYFTDYHAAADVMRSGFALGVGNAVVMGLVGGWMAIRAMWMKRETGCSRRLGREVALF